MKTETVCSAIKSVILGHAVGDALGVPVEFARRDKLDKHPVKEMLGFGTFPYPAGCWSDDTSMTLAALDSLAAGRLDWDEIMKNFGKWIEDGEYTPTGEAFDVGRTCLRSVIDYFSHRRSATEDGQSGEFSNGNGSLMRILPFVLYTAYCGDCGTDWLETIHTASCLTHAHRRSQIACGIYACVVRALLKTPEKAAVQVGLAEARKHYRGEAEFDCYARIFDVDFAAVPRDEIKSSGYVVDTLEAAIWCLLNTETYADCVLKAVNLGGDTDTVAAIAGGMAGALYGSNAIPKGWLDTLKRRDYIEKLCEKAALAWCK